MRMTGCTTLLLAVLVAPIPSVADDALAGRSWLSPDRAAVKQQLDQWLAAQTLDESARLKIDALWAGQGEWSHTEMLEQLVVTFAVVDPRLAPVASTCSAAPTSNAVPTFEILADESLAPFVRNNMRLCFGRWLAQHNFYDEALGQFEGLTPADVVDPASLLFYQSAGYHRLLDKEKCLPLVAKLLENEVDIPRRYATVARLMEADLKPLEKDSLDEIARLMDEIRRRLNLARAGTRVREQEDEVIAKLDKLIEEMEKQRKQKQSGGMGGGNSRSTEPAPDSGILGGRGPGNVDPRHIPVQSGWGNLPPKARQEALQQIGKELPAHYREVIEEYFRRLAQEGGN